jgi:hypothetical protein
MRVAGTVLCCPSRHSGCHPCFFQGFVAAWMRVRPVRLSSASVLCWLCCAGRKVQHPYPDLAARPVPQPGAFGVCHTHEQHDCQDWSLFRRPVGPSAQPLPGPLDAKFRPFQHVSGNGYAVWRRTAAVHKTARVCRATNSRAPRFRPWQFRPQQQPLRSLRPASTAAADTAAAAPNGSAAAGTSGHTAAAGSSRSGRGLLCSASPRSCTGWA